MEDRRPFRKYLSIVGLVGALTRSYANKIDYRCSRCAAHSSTDFCWCWETCLNRLRMLLAKPQSSSRFFWRKCLNSSYIIGSSALELAWSWPCSYPLKNDSRANLVALCRFSSVYLPGGHGTEAKAGAGVGAGAWIAAEASVGVRVRAGATVRAWKTAGVRMGVPLLSVEAPPALQWVRGLAIWTGWVDYFFCSSKRAV